MDARQIHVENQVLHSTIPADLPNFLHIMTLHRITLVMGGTSCHSRQSDYGISIFDFLVPTSFHIYPDPLKV